MSGDRLTLLVRPVAASSSTVTCFVTARQLLQVKELVAVFVPDSFRSPYRVFRSICREVGRSPWLRS